MFKTLVQHFTKFEYRLESIDPKVAAAELTHSYARQRRIVDRHVNYLLDTVEEHEFNPFDPIVAVVDNKTGKHTYVNGHHRLTMISRMSAPFQIAVLRLYSNNAEEDIPWLYASFDRGKSRTVNDVLQSFAAIDEIGLSPTQGGKVATAAILIESSFPASICGADYDAKSATHRNKLVVEYGPAAKLFFDDIAGCDPSITKLLVRSEVMAVAIVNYYWATSRAKASEFWKGIAEDDGLRLGDPRKALLTLLRSKQTRSFKTGQLSRLTAYAWNAFFDGEKRDFIKLSNNETLPEIVIKGSNFTLSRAKSKTAKQKSSASMMSEVQLGL